MSSTIILTKSVVDDSDLSFKALNFEEVLKILRQKSLNLNETIDGNATESIRLSSVEERRQEFDSNNLNGEYVDKNSKYWAQRYRLFSKYDRGIKLDKESWYSVTPERIAEHIALRFAKNNNFVVIDAFCGVGGNAIQFALNPKISKVIAIDIDERKIAFARHNANIYGVGHRIQFKCADYMLLAKSGALRADAVFLSPAWGGPDYNKNEKYKLESMIPNGVDVIEVTKAHICPNFGILLPRNIDENEFQLLDKIGNNVEIEENIIRNKVKTRTAYFGNLIRRQ